MVEFLVGIPVSFPILVALSATLSVYLAESAKDEFRLEARCVARSRDSIESMLSHVALGVFKQAAVRGWHGPRPTGPGFASSNRAAQIRTLLRARINLVADRTPL